IAISTHVRQPVGGMPLRGSWATSPRPPVGHTHRPPANWTRNPGLARGTEVCPSNKEPGGSGADSPNPDYSPHRHRGTEKTKQNKELQQEWDCTDARSLFCLAVETSAPF